MLTLISPFAFRFISMRALKPTVVEKTLPLKTGLLPRSSISMRTRFGAKSSRLTMTRSEPLTMKYPPTSSGSSPMPMRSLGLCLERRQRFDLTMMGRSPMLTFS